LWTDAPARLGIMGITRPASVLRGLAQERMGDGSVYITSAESNRYRFEENREIL